MDPTDLAAAHHHSSRHRLEILKSELCGCFYCGAVYPPSQIRDWIGGTARCPKCGIDAVLGSASGLSLTPEFLEAMRRRWF